MKRKNNYKKENCDNRVRASIHVNEIQITLYGTHGFNWSVSIEDTKHHVIRINEFFDRELAKAEYNKQKELYMPSSVKRKIR